MSVSCPFCNRAAELLTGDRAYQGRNDLSDRYFHVCKPCDARVGCHPGTQTPLGTMANAQLRRERSSLHSAFDPLWKEGKFSTRRAAYRWLAKRMGIPVPECHIGRFDLKRCRMAALVIADFLAA